MRQRENQLVTLKVLVATFAIVWFSASGFLFFEIRAKPDLTWGDAIWWSFVTMTTVGYGDYFPTTNWARFAIGLPTMLFGISILGYLLANVASLVIESKSKELRGMKQIKLSGHVLLIHYSDAYRVLQVVDELAADPMTRDRGVVLVDADLEQLPPELSQRGVKFVRGNPAREATLEQANFREATHALVLAKDPHDPRSDGLNLGVTMTIERLHAEIRTVTECVDPDSLEVLERTGSDGVVCPSSFSSSLLVQELIDPGVQAVFAELSSTTVGQQFFVIEITNMAEWTYGELNAWALSRGLLPVGLKRQKQVLLNPKAESKVEKGDEAVLIGADRPSTVDTSA